MGRKNRKGRSTKQNPRRFYRPKREREKAAGNHEYPRKQRRDPSSSDTLLGPSSPSPTIMDPADARAHALPRLAQ